MREISKNKIREYSILIIIILTCIISIFLTTPFENRIINYDYDGYDGWVFAIVLLLISLVWIIRENKNAGN